MKIITEPLPEGLTRPPVSVGDVYMNQRGKFQLVIAVLDCGTCLLVCFNPGGGITGVQKYATQYLDGKRVVGRAEVPDIAVDWIDDI